VTPKLTDRIDTQRKQTAVQHRSGTVVVVQWSQTQASTTMTESVTELAFQRHHT